MSASDDQVHSVANIARDRILSVMAIPSFTPGTAETIVFDVVGQVDVAKNASASVKDVGPAAVAVAEQNLKTAYGARNPRKGWIGFAMVVATLAAALAPAFALGLRSGEPGDFVSVSVALACVAAACEIVALAGSKLRPMNRFVFRMQGLICVALAIATAVTFAADLVVAGIVHAVTTAIAISVATIIIVVRARRGEETTEIDRCIEREYLAAITSVESAARRAQEELDAELPAADAALIVRVRTAVFADLAAKKSGFAEFDPLAPAGSAIIAAHTDPDRWLPTALAKTRHR